MRTDKIIFCLFAAGIVNGATDGHAASRLAPAETALEAPAAPPAGADQPANLRAAREAAKLPPLPSVADLRLKH